MERGKERRRRGVNIVGSGCGSTVLGVSVVDELRENIAESWRASYDTGRACVS